MKDDKWGVGDKADAEAFDQTRLGKSEVDLIFGEHPHSRKDNNVYARTSNGTVYDFDGHRCLIDIEIKSNNYLKESELSGDEIRKEVIGKIFADGEQVYEFFSRDPQRALLRAHHLIDELGEGAHNWLSAKGRAGMVGRKIWYHDQPATITRLVEQQGAIIIATGADFKPPRWDQEDDDDSWDDWRESDHYEVKDDVLSPHIWWFR